MRPFLDRKEAGKALATLLATSARPEPVLVLALPRGGVPVAAEVAHTLGAPLDVLVVRKLGTPGQPELAMGAIAGGGVRVLNESLVRALGLRSEDIDAVAEAEAREIERRERAYRGDRPALEPAGATVILVDDGMATGATMRAAVAAIRQRGAARVVVAVPHAPREVCRSLRREADEVVCVHTPEPYMAVGQWYVHFPQLTDREVCAALAAVPPKSTSS
jgi:putative phosphoribosyl transferase